MPENKTVYALALQVATLEFKFESLIKYLALEEDEKYGCLKSYLKSNIESNKEIIVNKAKAISELP